MKSHNIALLATDERAEIEMNKHASLLVFKLRRGQISRGDVQQAIDKVDESEREMFRALLNKYKGMR